MEKRCTWYNWSLWLKDRPCKIYVGQWPIFYGPLILPDIIVRLKLFLYIKKWHQPGVLVPLQALALLFSRSNQVSIILLLYILQDKMQQSCLVQTIYFLGLLPFKICWMFIKNPLALFRFYLEGVMNWSFYCTSVGHFRPLAYRFIMLQQEILLHYYKVKTLAYLEKNITSLEKIYSRKSMTIKSS